MTTRKPISSAKGQLKKARVDKETLKDLPLNRKGATITGGSLTKSCATGSHFPEAKLTS